MTKRGGWALWLCVVLLVALVALTWWHVTEPTDSAVQGAMSNCYVVGIAHAESDAAIHACGDEEKIIGARAFVKKYPFIAP